MKQITNEHYLRNKPGFGYEIGAIYQVEDQAYIVKSGIFASYLPDLIKWQDDANDVSYYIRTAWRNAQTLANLDPSLEQSFNTAFNKAFNVLKQKHAADTDQQFRRLDQLKLLQDEFIYESDLTADEQALLVRVFAAGRSEILSAAFAQTLYNTFLNENLGYETASIPDAAIISVMGQDDYLLTGSRFLANTTDFAEYLTAGAPAIKLTEDKKFDLSDLNVWLASKFENKVLKGLVATILLRLVFNELSDNSPINMLIDERNNHIIGIDISPFRVDRHSDNPQFNSYGYAEAFKAANTEQVLERLFHPSVFTLRYLERYVGAQAKELSLSQDQKKSLLQEIGKLYTDILKGSVRPVAMEEFINARNYVSGLENSLSSFDEMTSQHMTDSTLRAGVMENVASKLKKAATSALEARLPQAPTNASSFFGIDRGSSDNTTNVSSFVPANP